MRKAGPPKKIFYGWYVVLASALVMGVTMGIIYNCYGLFVVPVCDELGFSRQTMAMTQTLIALCGLFVSLFAGKLFTRRKTMVLMRISAVLTPCVYFLYSRMTEEWMVYAIALVLGFGYMTVNNIPISVIISNWFEEKRGLALGIAMMGSGLGGMVFNSVTGILLNACGWRRTYAVLALIILLVCVPCVFLVIRFCPEDLGLHPYGRRAEAAEPVPFREPEGRLFSDVRQTPQFWLLCFSLLLVSFVGSQISQTMSPRMLDSSYSVTFTAGCVSFSMALLAVGKVVVGRCFDRLGPLMTIAVGNTAMLFGAFGLLYSEWMPMVSGVILGFGFGCAFSSMAPPAITQCLYGRRDYAAVFGVINAVSSLGGIAGPMFSAWVFDASETYDPAYFVTIASTAVAFGIQFFLLRRQKPALQEG